ncbi:MAG: hypothetical protein ACT4QF_10680 [Sporichthyaceae bacterium]
MADHVPPGVAVLDGPPGPTEPPIDAEAARMNRTAQMLVVVCGPLLLAMLVGGLVFGRYLFPWIGPGDSAEEVAATYAEHRDRIRVAIVFTLSGFGLISVWGASVAAQVRRKEGVFPVLTYVQLVTMALGPACLMVSSCFWAAAAFRAGEVSPEITQTLNDLGYITLLSTWLPFSAWCFALGLSILLDRSATPVFPRWAAYLSIWAGLCYVPGNTVWFFKDGAFGWTGVICLYLPIGSFGIWVAVFSWLTYQNIQRGLVHQQELSPAT